MEEPNDPNYLLKQAQRCRAVAKTANNQATRQTLLKMAKDYDEQASALLGKEKP